MSCVFGHETNETERNRKMPSEWQDTARMARIIADDTDVDANEIDAAIRQADHVIRQHETGSRPIPLDVVRMRKILKDSLTLRLGK